jgi:hypothetical protein
MNMPYGKMFTFKDQDGNDFIVREDKSPTEKEVVRIQPLLRDLALTSKLPKH